MEEKLASLTRENRVLSMMLKAVEAIPLSRNFEESARHIYDICKAIIGATCGYVALLTEDGLQNEVFFVDDGGFPCDVDPDLPMPIWGLRAVAYETGEVEYERVALGFCATVNMGLKKSGTIIDAKPLRYVI